MKVLKFLVNSQMNLLAQSLVNYLVDSGHVVFIYPSDIENDLKWKSKYKHNLYVLDNNNLSLRDIDYVIDFDNLANISILSKIHFNIQLIDSEYFIISSLRNNSSDDINCINSRKLNSLSNSLSNNLNYLVNEITELFIDTVICLLRSENDRIILDNTTLNSNSIIDVVHYISTLEKLNDQYKLLENDENVFLIKNIVTINDANLEFSECKLILANQKDILTKVDFEILVLYLLTILNSRQNGVYGYDFYFSTFGGLVTDNKFSKFIDLNTLDSYISLLNKCNGDLYNIANNNFCPN